MKKSGRKKGAGPKQSNRISKINDILIFREITSLKKKMGKFVDVCIDGIEEYFTSKGYSAMLTLVNKNDSHVLYKVRLSAHAKKNVMVKSNTGLLLSNNNTTITLDIHKDEKPFNVQIVTTPFHEENCITNFSDMWAFVPENQLDKTIIRFDRDATGKPTASFYAPAFENQQDQEVMKVTDNKSAPSTDAQNLAEALSLVQQQNFDQEDEINQLKLKLEQFESQLEEDSRSISYAELMIIGCGFFILMNLFYSAFQI